MRREGSSPLDSLTRGQQIQGLRSFAVASGLWGAWGQTAGIGTAIITGFALHLGADESFIALLTSMAYIMAIVQLLAPLIGDRIGDKKRFVIGAGLAEILTRGALALIPLLLAPFLRLPAMVVIVGISLFFGNFLSPFFSTWLSTTIPENIRARFTSRQTIIGTMAAVASGIGIGQFMDLFSGTDTESAFIVVFAGGALLGSGGYLTLTRASYPLATNKLSQNHGIEVLLHPLRNVNFRRAILFQGSWTLVLGLAGPLYSVFMLRTLGLSYTQISIFNGLYLVASIIGYQLWAGLVDRFGGKPVLQLLLLPATAIPFLWIFNDTESYYLIPIALIVSGLVFSGLEVSVTPLLYELLPVGEERPFFLASWTASVNILGAFGPLMGSLLVYFLQGIEFFVFGLSIGNLQIVFGISALCRLLPMFLLRRINDTRSTSTRHLLSQMGQGNLLRYAFSSAVYNLSSQDETRARAAMGLGRSGNPLAVEQLIQALADASPRVRSSAAQALGETGVEKASNTLLKELADGSSDIRSEAAEALGRLGHASSLDALIEALQDRDPRVRISAIRGLSEIRGEEARELLYWHFTLDFDAHTFPTLVDVLSRLGEMRIVKPAILHLGQFPSPAIRLQLLNSICRSLGADNQFYRLLALEDTRRIDEIVRILKRAGNDFRNSRTLDTEIRRDLAKSCARLVQAYEAENTQWVIEAVRQTTGSVRDGIHAEGQKPSAVLEIYVSIETINSFLDIEETTQVGDAQDIFIAVTTRRLSQQVRGLKEQT